MSTSESMIKATAPIEDPERESLADLLGEGGAGAEDSRGPAPAKTANHLFDGNAGLLAELVGEIGAFALLAGPAGVYGFENPSVTLARNVRRGDLDALPMTDFDAVLESTDDVARLWEGQPTLQDLKVARNALLYEVLHDEELRDRAAARAKERIAAHRATLEEHGYRPLR